MKMPKVTLRLKCLLTVIGAVTLLSTQAWSFDNGLFVGASNSQRCQEYSNAWTPAWSSLIGYWPMNCSLGANTTSTIYSDFSPNSRNLTSRSAVTCEAGVNEQALAFSGSSQYASVNYSSALLPSQVTLSSWIKFGSFGGSTETMIISTFQGGGYGFEFDGTGYLAWSINVGGTYYYAKYATSNLSLNTWYLVTGTYDGANLKLYINSALVASTAKTGSVYYANNTPICFGQDADVSGCDTSRPYFNGSLDDAALWSVALTQPQIQQLYLRQNCDQLMIPQPASNVGLWHLNESLPAAASPTYSDSSSKGNNLTANGTIYGAMGKYGFSPVTSTNITYLYKDSPTGLPTSGSKTIAIWFKFTSTTYCKTALCNLAGYGNPNVNGANFQVGTYDNGTFMVWGWGGVTWDWQTGVSSTPYFDGNWHHIAVTYAQGSPNTTKIYLDGILRGTTTGYTYSPNPTAIVLGNEIDKSGQYLPGSLSEFGIWSVALTDSEILELFQKTLPIKN